MPAIAKVPFPIRLLAALAFACTPVVIAAQIPSDLSAALTEIGEIMKDAKESTRLCTQVKREFSPGSEVWQTCRNSFHGLAEAFRTQDKVVRRYYDDPALSADDRSALHGIHDEVMKAVALVERSAQEFE